MIRMQRTRSALFILDRALEVTRRQPLRELMRACLPGLCIGWLVVSLYALERVEGIRSLRLPFSAALVAMFLVRNLTLSQWSGRRVAELLSEQDPPRAAAALTLGAALWMGLNLWLVLWAVVAALRIEVWLLVAVIPIFCARAALAPSWLPALDRSREASAARALRAATRHAAGRRAQAMLCELLLIGGALALTFNLGAGLALLLSLLQQGFGLELTLLRAFLSPENEFGVLCIASLVWALFEPLRASVAAVLFAETENVLSGRGMRRMLERALTRSPRRLPLMCCAALSLTLSPNAEAQAPALPSPAAQMAQTAPCEEDCQAQRKRDAFWTERVHVILSSPAFSEFPADPWAARKSPSSPQSTLDGYLSQLADPADASSETPPLLPLRVQLGLLFLGTLLAIVVTRLVFQRPFLGSSRAAPLQAQGAPAAQPSARDVLSDAFKLLEQKPEQALGLLYLAALLGLFERNLIVFSKTHTNGSHLRQLKAQPEHALLSELTQRFEAVFYGGSTLFPHDLARCASLARSLVRGSAA